MWFIGDIALNGLIANQPENNKERFDETAKFFKNKSFIFANLETPIFINDSQNPNKNILHTTNEEAINVLREINIFGVSLANNHIFDCTEKGVQATIDWLKKNNIRHTGAGFKKEDLDPILFSDDEGKKIGFFAYVDEKTNPHCISSNSFQINFLHLEQIQSDLNRYRDKCDKLIVSLHWGVDYIRYVTENQIALAEKIIDLGADLIIGHHNHVIQPFNVYKGKNIFFGIGGLVFGDYFTHKGLESTFQKTKTGLIIHSENEQFSYFKSTDKKGNKISITDYNEFEVIGKSSFIKNEWFIRIKSIR